MTFRTVSRGVDGNGRAGRLLVVGGAEGRRPTRAVGDRYVDAVRIERGLPTTASKRSRPAGQPCGWPIDGSEVRIPDPGARHGLHLPAAGVAGRAVGRWATPPCAGAAGGPTSGPSPRRCAGWRMRSPRSGGATTSGPRPRTVPTATAAAVNASRSGPVPPDRAVPHRDPVLPRHHRRHAGSKGKEATDHRAYVGMARGVRHVRG